MDGHPPTTPAPTESGDDTLRHPAIQRVLAALAVQHITPEVVLLPDAVRTAAAAAQALGITPAEIANSLVFRAHEVDGTITPLLVLTSGAHRVDLVKVADLIDDIDHIDRADAEFVLSTTGFAIGGVAPVGHTEPVTTLIDEDLARWPEIWAAGGHPSTVFRLRVDELIRMTGGRVTLVKERARK